LWSALQELTGRDGMDSTVLIIDRQRASSVTSAVTQ